MECVSLEVKGFMTLWEGSSRLGGSSNGYLGISVRVALLVLVLAEVPWVLKQLLR